MIRPRLGLWATGGIDAWEGTDVCIVKPIENFHVAFSLRNLADEPARAVEFLQSEGVEHLRLINPYIADRTLEMLASEDKLAQRLRQLRIGLGVAPPE